MTIATVSHSEAESFVLCERRHFYSYGLTIQPKGSKLSDALYRGILGHTGLQHYYLALQEHSKFPLQAALGAVVTGSSIDGYFNPKIMGEVVALLEKYHDYWSVAGEDWKVLEVESSRMYKIHDNLETQIRPDLIVRVPGYGGIIVDHKWVYNFMTPTGLGLLPQLPKYLVGIQEMAAEYNIRGLLYNQVRYRELKGKTDPKTKIHTPATGKDLFRRDPLDITPARIKQTMKEHVIIAEQIANFKAKSLGDWEDSVRRSATVAVCKNCPFQELCVNDINSRPRDLMLQEMYMPKTRRQETEGNVEV